MPKQKLSEDEKALDDALDSLAHIQERIVEVRNLYRTRYEALRAILEPLVATMSLVPHMMSYSTPEIAEVEDYIESLDTSSEEYEVLTLLLNAVTMTVHWRVRVNEGERDIEKLMKRAEEFESAKIPAMKVYSCLHRHRGDDQLRELGAA